MNRLNNSNLDKVLIDRSHTITSISKIEAVNRIAREFAQTIIDLAPESADRTEALRCVRLARMWANSSIALDGEI